jgi:type I restriction enzyme S subunit
MKQRYPTYKSSGIEWIGEIPELWNLISLKYLVSSKITDGPHETPTFIEDGVPFLSVESVQNNRLDFNKKRGHISLEAHQEYSRKCKPQRDDILIVKSGSTTGKSTIVETDIEFNIWSPLCIVRSKPERIIPRFAFTSIQSPYFRRFVELGWSFGTQPNIGMGVIENIKLVVPPLTEQQQIVTFLNQKTTLIDQIISGSEKKIELLQERRTATINHAVTKGLNPKVKMKDSGVEWIGEIPRHWRLIKLKQKGEVIIGLSYSPENIVDENEGVLVMRSSNVQEGKPAFTDNVYVNSSVPERLRLKLGDILICSRNGSRNLIGKNCLITKDEEGMTFGVFMTIYRSKFYQIVFWILNSPVFESQSGLFLTSTINQLTVSTLENMVIPFVESEEEQQQIVTYLDQKTKEINDLIASEKKRIELLKEYRQSLISELVTGKIKVANG